MWAGPSTFSMLLGRIYYYNAQLFFVHKLALKQSLCNWLLSRKSLTNRLLTSTTIFANYVHTKKEEKKKVINIIICWEQRPLFLGIHCFSQRKPFQKTIEPARRSLASGLYLCSVLQNNIRNPAFPVSFNTFPCHTNSQLFSGVSKQKWISQRTHL